VGTQLWDHFRETERPFSPTLGAAALHLLHYDESNLEERSGDFFVYGGLIVDADAALSLTKAVEKIRRTAGLSDDAILKFNPCPDQVNHQQFSALSRR
jgi:hypothetical protein